MPTMASGRKMASRRSQARTYSGIRSHRFNNVTHLAGLWYRTGVAFAVHMGCAKKIAVLTALLLSGCAVNQVALQPADMPTCAAGKDCELKWAVARRWVLNNSGFKIQSITDDFIETFNSRDYASPRPWVRIVKEPIGEERYRITFEAGCNNMFGCVPEVRTLLPSFQAALASGQMPVAAPPPVQQTLPDGPRNPNAR
jgi:hypothetical protein